MASLLPLEKNVAQIDPKKLRVLIYGPPKIGKSTFVTRNPKALVIDTDNNGTEFLDCYRVVCQDWTLLKQILGEAVKDDRFDTIVIDTIDRAHQLCRDEVCKRNGFSHESDDAKGFGRMWDMVKAEFTKMIGYVSAGNKGLWMVSHSITKEVKIGNVKKQVTTMSMSDKPGRLVTSVADIILYMDGDETGKRTIFVKPEDSLECGDRTKALTENITFTTEQEAYDTFIKKFEEKGQKQ